MTTRKRILVIDDEKIWYLTVKNVLSPHRFEILWAKNRSEALEQLTRNPSELIVLDIRLSNRDGDTSGLALLKELRQSWPTIQVIVFTRYHMDLKPDMIVDCMKSGAYYYFVKQDFDTQPDRFAALVDEALAYQPTHDVIEDMYPHPLSLLYRDYRRNVVAPQLKFRRLLELVELLLKISAIISLSALDGDRRADLGRMSTNSLLKPSLGTWFEFLRYAIGQPQPQTIWVASMAQIFAVERKATVDSLIQLRNRFGHGVTRSDHEYQQMIDKWSAPVLELLNAARMFAAWQFFVVKSTRKIAGRYLHTIVNLRGHNPRFLHEELELPIECEADKVYVWDAVGSLLCLHPFIAIFVCDLCNQETIFVYDKLDRNSVLYLDYANGHPSTQIESYRAVKNMLEPNEI
jgi:two-component system, response regulator, stage 0 sporulation protein F